MLLVQNSLRYVYIMTFESIQVYFGSSRQVCFKELKIKLILLLNLKHGAQRSHSEACSLKKTTLYSFCFQMSCVVFWNQKKSG